MRKWGIVFIFLVAVAWTGHTFSKNFIVDPEFTRFLEHKGSLDLAKDEIWTFFLRTHIVLSLLALLSGPVAFLKSSRRKKALLHKLSGRIYVLSILLNILPALYVSFFATGGWISVLGFICLNAVWSGTTFLAYKKIRERRVLEHRKWMIRSYAITLANTSIYILTLIFTSGFGMDYILSYQISVWLGWVMNLILAEGIVRRLKRV